MNNVAEKKVMEAAKWQERKRGLPPPLGYYGSMPVSFEVLCLAKKRPRGCSEVRWRIELSRRRLAAKYSSQDHALNFLPDPDGLA